MSINVVADSVSDSSETFGRDRSMRHSRNPGGAARSESSTGRSGLPEGGSGAHRAEEEDPLTPRQAAAAIFSRRLSELIAESVVSTEDGVTRSLTLYSLAQHLELAYPDVPVSQSGLYRLVHGDAIPRLDLIIALARVFDVPPEYFVTSETTR